MYWTPRSEWHNKPSGGWRLRNACSWAWIVGSAPWESRISRRSGRPADCSSDGSRTTATLRLDPVTRIGSGCPHVELRKFTHHSKTELVQRLIVTVEQTQISWPMAWEVMKRFEYAISSNGSITYNAPSGYHDDCVIALALANSHRQEYAFTGSMIPISRALPASCLERVRTRGLP